MSGLTAARLWFNTNSSNSSSLLPSAVFFHPGGGMGWTKQMDEPTPKSNCLWTEILKTPRIVCTGHRKVELPFDFDWLAWKTCLVWKGSQTSFSMFPPARKMVVTTPISTQEKMKLKPTPLWKTDRQNLLRCSFIESLFASFNESSGRSTLLSYVL